MEDNMPISTLTAKGQVTIPKEIRKALGLQPLEKIIIVVEGGQAIIRPLRGSILDIGGTVRIPAAEKPIRFRSVRDEVKKKIAAKVAGR